MSEVEVKGPWAHTRLAKFLEKRIRQLAPRKTQREIALQAGYTNPNLVSMMKTGNAKLPLDRVPALAKALDVDAALLIRMVLEQHVADETLKIFDGVFARTATENEADLLAAVRKATGDSDPSFTKTQLDKVIAALTSH